jgi:hypothetical protein
MNTVATLRAPDVHPAEPLASWYMPGMIDGFGDRLLMIDNAANDALELLRFRAALVATPGFEDALHDRVQQLRRLAHAALPTVRGVERLERDGSLVLVSTSTPGQRLSEFLDERQSGKGLHPAFVIWIVSQTLEPISVLHAEGEDVAHTALTAERIILAPDGRVRIVEHVLGSALRHLDCSPVRLWREFGILVPCDDEGRFRLDGRGDVFQLGVVALSMLLGRRITRGDVDHRLPSLLDQWSESPRSQLLGEPLRRWLERALQIGDRPYHSAAEAHAGLRELPLVSASRAFEFLQAGSADGQATQRFIPSSTARTSGEGAQNATRLLVNAGRASEWMPTNELTASAGTETTGTVGVPASAPMTPQGAPRSRALRTAIAIVLVAAVVEGVVIARLLVRQPREPALSRAAPSSVLDVAPRPVRQAAGPTVFIADTLSLTPRPAVGQRRTLRADNAEALARRNPEATAAVIAQAARNQRLGGVRLSTPIELKVLQGDRVLGSSADGVIVASAGTHDLELINASLGFRIRRAVTFRPGEITTLVIPVSPGRLNVNAMPWAEVWIDGRSVGETPLGNVEVPIGEHDLVFRHPDLGERLQRVVVRADTVTRVATTFDR